MPKTSSILTKEVPTTPEARKNKLQNMFEDVQNKNRSLNSNQVINQNKLKETKIKLIQELFKMMQNLGVDPNNLESINQFLQQLDAQNPDLRELFEVAFGKLIGDSDVNPEAPPAIPETPQGTPQEVTQPVAEPAGLMDRFKNLAPQALMPR